MKFNWLDIIFMALAVRGLFVGVRRGILGELVLTASILASMVGALFIGSPTGGLVASRLSFGIHFTHQFIAWLVMGTGILVAFLLGKIVQKLSHLIIQSPIDKIIGALLGGGRAILLSAILVTALIHWGQTFFQTHAGESVLASYLTPKVDEAYALLKQKMTPAELVQIKDELSADSDQENMNHPPEDTGEAQPPGQ